MQWERAFLALAAISLLLQAAISFQGSNLWWDEAVYVGLARSLPSYSLDPDMPVENFRPPLFPLLLSPLLSLEAMKLLALAFSAAAFLALYTLARPHGKRVAALAVLFLSTSFLYIFFAPKLLTEPLLIAFLSLSLLHFQTHLDSGSRKHALLSGLFAGLAFLTRYLAVILLAAYVLTLLLRLRKKPPSPLFLLSFLATIAPWLLLNQAVYGSPVHGFLLNLSVYSVSAPQSFLEGLMGIGVAWGFLLPLVLVFPFLFRKSLQNHLPLLLTFLLTLAYYLAVPHKEPRYLLSFMPVYALMAALSASGLPGKIPKNVLLPALLLLSAATLWLGASASWENMQASALVDASLYLDRVASPGDSVLTQSYPFIYALTGLEPVTYCPLDDQRSFDECQGSILSGENPLEKIHSAIQSHDPEYALSYRHEPSNPEEAREFLENRFMRVKSFGEFGDPDAAVVYKIT